MEKKKQNISKIIQITIILLIILGIGTVIVKQVTTPNVWLTQLQDNSSRQMMGYIMKTSTGKVIVIDGGLNEDEPNLVKHIQEFKQLHMNVYILYKIRRC